ncbi:hypothetical protein BC826DRAFT_528021 [Russula brevipes]|nr:hypothetical protein BC826DRAFT_528021 [Russula brevipes]
MARKKGIGPSASCNVFKTYAFTHGSRIGVLDSQSLLGINFNATALLSHTRIFTNEPSQVRPLKVTTPISQLPTKSHIVIPKYPSDDHSPYCLAAHIVYFPIN